MRFRGFFSKRWIYLIFPTLLISCIDKKFPNILALFASGTKPYIYEDIGLPSVENDSVQASLPIISHDESEAIEAMLKELSDYEIDDKIYRESIGQIVPDKVAGSSQELIAKELAEVDNFFGKVESDFPILSIYDLVNVRKRLTLSLIVIRLEIDYGDRNSGIPEDLLKGIRVKTVALRQKVTQELLRRGVTKI